MTITCTPFYVIIVQGNRGTRLGFSLSAVQSCASDSLATSIILPFVREDFHDDFEIATCFSPERENSH